MKRIALIGSTGSIGRQTIEVALASPDEFRIVAMAAGSSHAEFSRQVAAIKPEYAALADGAAARKVTEIPACTAFAGGEEAALAAAAWDTADVVLVAAGGFAGLKYSLAAIRAGKTLALANKETLVCGGDCVMPLAERAGVEILPVDSEHSAIWQCLGLNRRAPFRRLIITASGGPFRGYTAEQLRSVTPQMALRHPTWSMGAKITTDSATMLNKGFEIIEAHHLFGAEYTAINVVIHPQSIVHSMVELCDGAVLAQLSRPTMKLPIQLALSYPQRLPLADARPDLSKALSLEFLPLERGMYPCFDIALQCAREGGTLPCALNAAGEVAVRAFLECKIAFTQIADVLSGVLCHTVRGEADCYEALCEADGRARSAAGELVRRLAGRPT